MFTFTASAAWAGLQAAARFARLFGDEDEEKYERAASEVRTGILEYLWVDELAPIRTRAHLWEREAYPRHDAREQPLRHPRLRTLACGRPEG